MNTDLLTPERIAEFTRNVFADPLAQRFLRRVEASGDNQIRTAEDVLGERLTRMAAMIELERISPGHIMGPFPLGADRMAALFANAAIAIAAKPYLWTEEVRDGLRGMTLPKHTVSPRILPEPRSWHTFETGINLGGTMNYEGRRYENGVCDALLVVDTGDGMNVLQFGEMTDSETGDQRQCITGGGIKYGLVHPDDFEEGWDIFAEGVLMMFSFLNSPYIPKRQERASRAARRDAIRAGQPLEDEPVTFVTLRRPEPRHKKPTEEEDTGHWKHQWLVSGHHRAQWYPSEQAHRLIWIAPHLKGPKDAPMLNHAYRVAR